MFGTPMQTARHILSTILIFAVLVSGLPSFIPEDANRDSRVDLKDAVLHVQDFAQTADNPAAFMANFEKAVSALQALAGLKTVIKRADNAKSMTTQFCPESPCLISFFNLSLPQHNSSKLLEKLICYQSISISPNFPPPRFV